MMDKPWILGPKELLDHAKAHLSSGKGFDYRIAIISIDNAVELAIRTYLSLPKRIRDAEGPTRRELELASGFPDLLDLLEKYAEDKISGIELGDIEWYHRLRNTLYHEGNGVTVDPERVDAYSQIAHLLFQNLFEFSASPEPDASATSLLGSFILKWATMESRIRTLAAHHLPKAEKTGRTALSLFDGLIAKGVLPSTVRGKLERISRARNSAIHGATILPAEYLNQLIAGVDEILDIMPEI